jgi:hypothetical protein
MVELTRRNISQLRLDLGNYFANMLWWTSIEIQIMAMVNEWRLDPISIVIVVCIRLRSLLSEDQVPQNLINLPAGKVLVKEFLPEKGVSVAPVGFVTGLDFVL